MVSDFLLPWSRLNLLSLLSEKQEELVKLGVPREDITYFEYEKSEKGYWTEEHQLDQIVKKVLSIRKTLYSGYVLLFLFDNAISHSIYVQDVLQVAHINKGPRGSIIIF